MKDFFISYNSADQTWAEWIAWQLEEAHYTTVLQAWDFLPGENFILGMHDAAKMGKSSRAKAIAASNVTDADKAKALAAILKVWGERQYPALAETESE
jgi:hypothetical protein